MKSCSCGIGMVFFAVGFVLAADASPYERAIQRMLGNLNDISKILQSIESEETADSARPELRKAAKSWIEARDKAAKLPPPERAEKERLTKIYKPKIDETVKKMNMEIRRVKVIPGGKNALNEIRSVLPKDDK